MKNNKNKLKSFCVSILAVLCFCFAVSFNFANFGKINNSASAIKISEEDLVNISDLLTTDEQTLTTMFGADKISPAPFSSSSADFMAGKSITPTADKFNQTSELIPFSVIDSKINAGQSIYVWVFIPDEPLTVFYNLTFKLFLSSNESITWTFNANDLNKMCQGSKGSSSVSYGWKLFELSVLDATENFVANINEKNLSSLQVIYESGIGNDEIMLVYPTFSLSIYHIFLADSKTQNSGIIGFTNYSSYKVKESFLNSLSGIYAGDTKVLCKSSADIFEYAHVGKTDLSNANIAGYFWQLQITGGGVTEEYEFDKSYNFFREGEYKINLKLKEQHESRSTTVISYEYSFLVNRFTLGYFALPDYSVETKTTKLVVFNFSNGLIIDSDISIRCSDNSVASIQYDKKDGRLEVKVTGLKKGIVTLTIEGTGHREGYDSEIYSSQVQVRVVSQQTDTFTQTILWGSLGILGAILLIIALISVVKARKNSVK